MKADSVVAAYRQFRNRLMTEIADQKSQLIIGFVGRNDATDSYAIARDYARSCRITGAGAVLLISAGDASQASPSPDILLDMDYIAEVESGIQGRPIDQTTGSSADETLMVARVAEPRVYQLPTWNSAREVIVDGFDTVVIDAGHLGADGLAPWHDILTRTILVLDSGNTSIADLERLRIELDTGRIVVDGAVLSQKQLYVPDWIYRRLW